MIRPIRANATAVFAVSIAILACSIEPATPVRFKIAELVTNLTETEATVVLLPEEPVELYVAYGADPALLEKETGVRELKAGEPVHFTLSGLEPGRRVHYEVRLRRLSGPAETSFIARERQSFVTLRRDRDATFRFAYAADSHIVGRYVQAACTGDRKMTAALANFERALEHIEAAEPDFVIAAGDNFMTHAPMLKSCERSGDLGNGTVQSAEDADRRYELGLSPALWGRITGRVPFFTLLGNHEGEARFGDASGSYGHFSSTRNLSRAARRRVLPDPTRVYRGSENGDLYYSFDSGAARFIVLDIMSGPEDYPLSAEDWMLDEAQTRWLEEVLEDNDQEFTFVFVEHLLGAETIAREAERRGPKPPFDYHYGRGGLRSTLDGTPKGTFTGGQAKLHALLRDRGVDFVFHGHDHVAVAGEKKNESGAGEGVFYVMGGQVAGDGDGPKWDVDWFRQAMDYDGDGVEDYRSGVNGSVRSGFYLVTVHGSERVDVAYIASDAVDPAVDGRTEYAFEVRADGTHSLPF